MSKPLVDVSEVEQLLRSLSYAPEEWFDARHGVLIALRNRLSKVTPLRTGKARAGWYTAYGSIGATVQSFPKLKGGVVEIGRQNYRRARQVGSSKSAEAWVNNNVHYVSSLITRGHLPFREALSEHRGEIQKTLDKVLARARKRRAKKLARKR